MSPSTSASTSGASGYLSFLNTYPSTPNTSIIHTSNMLLWTVYDPIAQMTTMIGAMMENGMRRMAAHHGTVVSTTIRPAMLPRYMLAMSPHTKSFFSTNSSGPG